MPHSAAVVSLLFTFAAAPVAAESAAVPLPPAADDDFFASLEAPVVLENVRADVADGDLEVSFELQEVGRVSVAVYAAEDEGSGRGVVTVEDEVVTEVGFVDGAVAWETSDFSALSPAQAVAVVAGLLQVWHDDAVTDALADARDLKCWWVGKIAGTTLGLGAFAGCGLAAKNPKCVGVGFGVASAVSGYISDKCNGAQNK
jgi:hypothetical protein